MAQTGSALSSLSSPVNQDTFFFSSFLAIIMAAVVSLISFTMIERNKTVPSGNWMIEGYQGPPKGVSQIQCGQESSFVTAILDIFATKTSTTGDGNDDLKEFKLILSKLCCFKHDLMSTNKVVKSTMTLPFSTYHDRENLGDTTSRCFSKTIPPRDLEISFTTWRERAFLLLHKLCTSFSLTEQEETIVKKHFMSTWFDTYTIARDVCLAAEPTTNTSPRDLKGLMAESLRNQGEYKGYY